MLLESHQALLAENLAHVRARMDAALARAGRPADAARLVCVTKALSVEHALGLARAGAQDLAENRVQALVAKQEAFAAQGADTHGASAPPVRWHMIGALQRNKVKRFLETGALLHALDREALCAELEARLAAAGVEAPLDVLVEVNVAREAHKHGVSPEGLPALLDRIAAGGRVRARGLMAMAPADAPLAEARAVFAALRALRDRARERHPALEELSMGMSQDFEVACEEGASLVRVGSLLARGLPAAEEARAPGGAASSEA